MASAQVVKTSVTNNSPSQGSNHPDDLFQSRYSHFSRAKQKICNNSARKKHFQIISFLEQSKYKELSYSSFLKFRKIWDRLHAVVNKKSFACSLNRWLEYYNPKNDCLQETHTYWQI